MLISDKPTAHEDKSGLPICGPAGQELDETYLRLAGLDRDDIYATSAVQCRHERNGQDVAVPEGLFNVCATNHIAEEVWAVGPEIIILLGGVACGLVSGVDLDMDHGRPREVVDVPGLGRWSGTVVPMYHPAAGMREGRFMIYSLEDWEKFGLWLRGKLQFPSLTVKPRYRLISRVDEFWELMAGQVKVYDYLPLDTESDEGKVWSVQFSTEPGVGFMILTEAVDVIEAFSSFLEFIYKNQVLMHHAVHDLDELDQIGIYVSAHRDTMQELYHLGNLPQGLKAAVYRTLGHRMISYRETVVPHSKAVLDAWLSEALLWATEHRIVEPHPPGPDCITCGKKHRLDVSKHKPHEAEAVLRRIMAKVQCRDGDEGGSDYDPWQKPKLQHGEEKPRLLGRSWLEQIEREVRRMPRQSIIHVPLEEAVQYGCSDADYTGRLGTWLEHERERIVIEEWRTAA